MNPSESSRCPIQRSPLRISPDARPPVPEDSATSWWGHEPHQHSEAQLVYAAAGSCVVEAQGRAYRVDARTALWVPAGLRHSARFDAEFFPACLLPAPDLPDSDSAHSLEVSPSLRQLILRFCRESEDTSARRLLPLIGTALRSAASTAGIPIPTGPLTAQIAAAFDADPAHDGTLEDWSRRLHCGVATLRRAFLAETGMSFTDWRTGFRLERSLHLLEGGAAVSSVAQRVGMTPNGYTAAFRRTFGSTPAAHRAA